VPTAAVQILRKPPLSAGPQAQATPIKVIHTDVPPGAEEHGDATRQAVQEAVARFASVPAAQVSIHHREAGGYLAYLPPLPESV
jgi:hypothetical protein